MAVNRENRKDQPRKACQGTTMSLQSVKTSLRKPQKNPLEEVLIHWRKFLGGQGVEIMEFCQNWMSLWWNQKFHFDFLKLWQKNPEIFWEPLSEIIFIVKWVLWPTSPFTLWVWTLTLYTTGSMFSWVEIVKGFSSLENEFRVESWSSEVCTIMRKCGQHFLSA